MPVPEASGTAGTSSYTVRFEAAATNTYGENTAYDWVDDVPRLLRVVLVLDNRELEQDLFVHANDAFTTYHVTFLDVPNLSNDRRIEGVTFRSGEETGSVRIRSPQLFRGSAERWVRYFEHGAVLLNASDDDWAYELAPLFADGYRRLEGEQDSTVDDVNDGSAGGGAGMSEFTVPAKDALLVRGEGATTSTPTQAAPGLALEQNRPNPFNPKTTFSFALDVDGPASLAIYDVSGRLVRTLLDEALSRGRYAREWDGRTESGDRVASGAYFVRLRSGDRLVTSRAVLLE